LKENELTRLLEKEKKFPSFFSMCVILLNKFSKTKTILTEEEEEKKTRRIF
jgi:hypothetical protein